MRWLMTCVYEKAAVKVVRGLLPCAVLSSVLLLDELLLDELLLDELLLEELLLEELLLEELLLPLLAPDFRMLEERTADLVSSESVIAMASAVSITT